VAQWILRREPQDGAIDPAGLFLCPKICAGWNILGKTNNVSINPPPALLVKQLVPKNVCEGGKAVLEPKNALKRQDFARVLLDYPVGHVHFIVREESYSVSKIKEGFETA
jgi:hypothetical protein